MISVSFIWLLLFLVKSYRISLPPFCIVQMKVCLLFHVKDVSFSCQQSGNSSVIQFFFFFYFSVAFFTSRYTVCFEPGKCWFRFCIFSLDCSNNFSGPIWKYDWFLLYAELKFFHEYSFAFQAKCTKILKIRISNRSC